MVFKFLISMWITLTIFKLVRVSRQNGKITKITIKYFEIHIEEKIYLNAIKQNENTT